MREINIGSQIYTKVISENEKEYNAYHHYTVINSETEDGKVSPEYASVNFQKGPVKECGQNGCQNEDLIAIVIDRLRCFQASEFSCRENAIALTKLEEALLWLNYRTQSRTQRGVEGLNRK